MKRLVLVGFLVSAVLLSGVARPALAKGNIGKVSVTGPGLAKTLDVTDRATLSALVAGALENFSKPIEQPASIGLGYDIVRYMQEPNADMFAFDHVRYFPGKAGDSGYVYYVGMVGGSSDFDKEWFKVTVAGDAAMHKLLDGVLNDLTKNPLVAKQLDTVPQNCAQLSHSKPADPFNDPVVIISLSTMVQGFDGPQATLLPDATQTVTDFGWRATLHWFNKDDNTIPVTMWGHNLADNSPVWFALPGSDPSTVLTLDENVWKATTESKTVTGWSELPTTLYIPKAGCYSIEAHWHNSVTMITFAAGQPAD